VQEGDVQEVEGADSRRVIVIAPVAHVVHSSFNLFKFEGGGGEEVHCGGCLRGNAFLITTQSLSLSLSLSSLSRERGNRGNGGSSQQKQSAEKETGGEFLRVV
jgi:hypothetical protein